MQSGLMRMGAWLAALTLTAGCGSSGDGGGADSSVDGASMAEGSLNSTDGGDGARADVARSPDASPRAASEGGGGSDGSNCTGATSTLTVTVINDTNTPVNVCNATVKASGPTQITLTATGGPGSCSYQGSVEGGTYEVTATATGYETSNAFVTVQSGCSVSISLDVTPSP